jgi:dTDP-4-amino-4,6-dideoxygalactose transaminase
VAEAAVTAGVPLLDLPALHASIAGELEEAWRRVVERQSFIAGPECAAFEEEWARYCGAASAVGVGNGLDALRLALLALGVGPGDEVIVPGHTFIATWLAVDAVGAVPVPVEVMADCPQIDPTAAAAAVTPRTVAVIAVHLYGGLAPMAALRELADRHGLALVEDAAQAHGARLSGVRTGALADIAAFSFYPGKNLGALGDGGAVVTSDPALAERARLHGNYGSRRKYQHEVRGGNSRLDELQAAVLRVKLRHLDRWNAVRSARAEEYQQLLAQACPAARLTGHVGDSEPVHHLMVVRVPDRQGVLDGLERRAVGAGVHYPLPPHRTEAYAQHPAGRAHLPVSEAWCRDALSLPMGPTLGSQDVTAVVDALADVLQRG